MRVAPLGEVTNIFFMKASPPRARASFETAWLWRPGLRVRNIAQRAKIGLPSTIGSLKSECQPNAFDLKREGVNPAHVLLAEAVDVGGISSAHRAAAQPLSNISDFPRSSAGSKSGSSTSKRASSSTE